MFRKAERKQAKLRLALCGPSGSGKTYSALLLAQGLAPEGKVALIDTERGSGDLYADLAAYDLAPLDPPFTPARYIALIREAERAGYAVLIVDSLSHAWAGEGGILDMHDKAAAASRGGNAFAAWREVTPAHNQLVDRLLGADLHLITTLRTKTAYDLVDDRKGKKRPVKIGLAPVQRDGMEYEFTLVLDLSVDSHGATATKDRTRLFDAQHFVPTRETGEALRDWLATGQDPVEASKQTLCRLEAEAAAIEEAKRRMDARARAAANQARRLKAYLKAALERTGLKPKAPDLALRVQRNPPAVVVDDPAGVPAVFKQTETVTRLLKAEIGRALKAGEGVAGAHLERTTRLVMR